jgi:hypothetical protein
MGEEVSYRIVFVLIILSAVAILYNPTEAREQVFTVEVYDTEEGPVAVTEFMGVIRETVFHCQAQEDCIEGLYFDVVRPRADWDLVARVYEDHLPTRTQYREWLQ